MLKRVIENWLISTSEYEFEYPFRLLLEAEGHQAFERRTRHGPAEKGKDIVTYQEKEKKFYTFQLKAGNVTRHDWVDMEVQLKELVELPPLHPNYDSAKPTQPIWVTTGDLDPYVAQNMSLKNAQYEKERKLPVRCWNLAMLIEKFHDKFFDIVCDDEEFVIRFVSLLVHTKPEEVRVEDTISFFVDYFKGQFHGNQRRTRKVLASSLVMEMQILNRYLREGDIDTAIDHLLIFSTQFAGHVLRNRVATRDYKHAYSLLLEIIVDLLGRFEEGVMLLREQKHPLKNSVTGGPEVFEYPLRTTATLGKICLLIALRGKKQKPEKNTKELITAMIEKNPVFWNIISERQQAEVVMTVCALEHLGANNLAKDIVGRMLSRLCFFHADNNIGLPDPYRGRDHIVKHFLKMGSEGKKINSEYRTSYMLPCLLKLAVDYNLRNEVESNWQYISKITCQEFDPVDETDLFEFRATRGEPVCVTFPVVGSWQKLQQRFLNAGPVVPLKFLKKHQEFICILVIAFPWRMDWRFTEMIRACFGGERDCRS